MSEVAKIVVHPSGADIDLLPVRDALTQVLDFVELLNHAQLTRDGQDKVVWLLESITSNSPITAQIIGAGTDPAAPVDEQALHAMASVSVGIAAAMDGGVIPSWMLNGGYAAARRFFERNTEKVGRTDLFMNGFGDPIYIPSAKARVALINLERAALSEAEKVKDWTHKAHGSIEGIVTDTTSFYTRPAIRVRERISGRDIICVFVDTQTAERIGDKYNWNKNWRHGRVRVEGVLHYDKVGNVVRVSATDVIEVHPPKRRIGISDFADRTFTGGMTPAEYLEHWRDHGRG